MASLKVALNRPTLIIIVYLLALFTKVSATDVTVKDISNVLNSIHAEHIYFYSDYILESGELCLKPIVILRVHNTDKYFAGEFDFFDLDPSKGRNVGFFKNIRNIYHVVSLREPYLNQRRKRGCKRYYMCEHPHLLRPFVISCATINRYRFYDINRLQSSATQHLQNFMVYVVPKHDAELRRFLVLLFIYSMHNINFWSMVSLLVPARLQKNNFHTSSLHFCFMCHKKRYMKIDNLEILSPVKLREFIEPNVISFTWAVDNWMEQKEYDNLPNDWDEQNLKLVFRYMSQVGSCKRAFSALITKTVAGRLNQTIQDHFYIPNTLKFSSENRDMFYKRDVMPKLRGPIDLKIGSELVANPFVGGSSKAIIPEWTMITSIGRISFLTCYTTRFVSFDSYADPFQINLWIGLSVFIILFVGILKVLAKLGAFGSKISMADFDLSSVTNLIDVSINIPSSVERNIKFRLVIGLWLLTGIIFPNAYKSLAITGVTSPLPFTKYLHFENITSNIFDCVPGNRSCNTRWKYNERPKIRPNDFVIFSFPTSRDDKYRNGTMYYQNLFSCNLGDYLRKFITKTIATLLDYSVLENAPTAVYWDRSSKILRSIGRIPDSWISEMGAYDPPHLAEKHHVGYFQLYVPNGSIFHPLPPMETAIEEELIKCKRSALVDTNDVIQEEYEYLKLTYPGLPFYVSKDTIEDIHNSWIATRTYFSRLPEYLTKLLESGIYSHLSNIFIRSTHVIRVPYSRNLTKQKYESVVAIRLTDNIQTVYYIYAGCIALSTLLSLAEIAYMRGPSSCFGILSQISLYSLIAIRLVIYGYKRIKLVWNSF